MERVEQTQVPQTPHAVAFSIAQKGAAESPWHVDTKRAPGEEGRLEKKPLFSAGFFSKIRYGVQCVLM
jgi:hypothetical protein